jgi:hypothetical protein
MLMKSVVFWVITRRRVVIIYRRFGTTYRSHPHGSRFQDSFPLGILTREDGTDTLSETSVNNYHTTPCNYPKDHRFQRKSKSPHTNYKFKKIFFFRIPEQCIRFDHISSEIARKVFFTNVILVWWNYLTRPRRVENLMTSSLKIIRNFDA